MRLARRTHLRILVTEDHASTRFGIKQILLEEFPEATFGEAANAQETLARLNGRTWDLLILDISLPDKHGLDVLLEVRRSLPHLPVLIYSAHPEDQFAVHAIRHGAAGYLTKERAPEELNLAVRKILAGEKYLQPHLAATLDAGTFGGGDRHRHNSLSKREFLVFRLTAEGKSGKAIAAELNLSQKTVSTYRGRILRKLGLTSTAELVSYAVRHGLS